MLITVECAAGNDSNSINFDLCFSILCSQMFLHLFCEVLVQSPLEHMKRLLF